MWYTSAYIFKAVGGVALKYGTLMSVNHPQILKWMVSKNILHSELLEKFRSRTASICKACNFVYTFVYNCATLIFLVAHIDEVEASFEKD